MDGSIIKGVKVHWAGLKASYNAWAAAREVQWWRVMRRIWMQSKWDAGGKSKESGPKEEFEWASGVQVLRGGSIDSYKAPSPSLLPICRKTDVRTGPWTD